MYGPPFAGHPPLESRTPKISITVTKKFGDMLIGLSGLSPAVSALVVMFIKHSSAFSNHGLGFD